MARTSKTTKKTYEPKPEREAPVTWSDLLVAAVNEPGIISDAYTKFHGYSLGNQMLAAWQCMARGIQPGPLATFKKWQSLGRSVQKGQTAIVLCMPRTFKIVPTDADAAKWVEKCRAAGIDPTKTDGGTVVAAINAGTIPQPPTERTGISRFHYAARWFVLSQTDGDPFVMPDVPEWDTDRALESLGVEIVPFKETDGNVQGYCVPDLGHVAINPMAKRPEKTLFHELGHAVLHKSVDRAEIDRPIREVEAECVALLVTTALSIASDESTAEMRGYIQNWLGTGNAIDDKTAQRIFSAAQRLIAAGRDVVETAESTETAA